MASPQPAALSCNGRAWWILAGVALMAGPVATAAAAAAVSAVTATTATGLLTFDIPAQPLTDALSLYSTLTRRAGATFLS